MRQSRPLVRLTGLILVAGGLGLAVRAARADNWPRFRGDNGSAVSKEDGLNRALESRSRPLDRSRARHRPLQPGDLGQ